MLPTNITFAEFIELYLAFAVVRVLAKIVSVSKDGHAEVLVSADRDTRHSLRLHTRVEAQTKVSSTWLGTVRRFGARSEASQNSDRTAKSNNHDSRITRRSSAPAGQCRHDILSADR